MYVVQKEKGGRYYVCDSENLKMAIPGTFRKEKKDAIKTAAEMMGLSVKEYLKLRKSDNQI